MKKILSLLLAVALIASILAVFSVSTAAEDNHTLTVTCQGRVLGEVEVGSDFIYHVGLDSGGISPQGGQGELRYDSDYVQIIEYGPLKKDGTVNMDAYCFPNSIYRSSLVTNYTDRVNRVNYDFAKFSGIGVFSDVNQHYFKIRFKAIAPGTVEIRHYFSALYATVNNKSVRLIYNDKSNEQLDPIPYSINYIETPAGYVGDADEDLNISVIDATFIQRIVAGENHPYTLAYADADGDGDVSLRDALNIMRYVIDLPYNGNIGDSVFASD